MKYSVCAPAVFGGNVKTPGISGDKVDLCLAVIRKAGYSAYEFWSWWNQDVEKILSEQEVNGLYPAALCTRFISLTDPELREAYIEGLEETIGVAKKLGTKTIISQVGNERAGVPREEQHESIVNGLRAAAPLVEEAGMTLVIEPLNTKIDHKGYYLWESAEAYEIVDEVASPNVKVLFDLYHQYIMDDLKIEEILKNMDRIGHFHMAGYPGRHEPYTDCEIDYDAVLTAIRDSGYAGYVGLEYFPLRDAETGLRELTALLP